MLTQLIIFAAALAALVVAGNWLIRALVDLSRYFGLKEFVVAFFTVSIGAVAPEFIVGISSALRGMPEIALGNVVGENIFLLTVTVALCTFISRQGLTVESRTVRVGITFTIAVALLPLLLILDGELSRIDGAVLIFCFLLFVGWLFARKDRFLKVYQPAEKEKISYSKSALVKNLALVFGGAVVVIASAQILINTAEAIHLARDLPLTVIGLFFLAIGTALPETYFAINLTRRRQAWMVLGGIMGGVAIASTLVLGTVALIQPIVIADISSLILARIFLAIAAVVFLATVSTSNRITKREGIILLAIYLAFLLLEISLP